MPNPQLYGLIQNYFLPFFTSKLDERPENKNTPFGEGSTSLRSVNPLVGGFKENDCRAAPFFCFPAVLYKQA